MPTCQAEQNYETRIDDSINRRQGRAPNWCETCGEDVLMIIAEKAAAICQCSRRKIYRWVEEGDLHYIEMPDGAVFVCGKSLSRKIDDLDSSTGKLIKD